MTFKQHEKLIKEGVKLFDDQMKRLDELKKEKITITINEKDYIPKKGDIFKFEDKKICDDEEENCPKNKHYKFLGNKRNFSTNNNNRNFYNKCNSYQGKHFLDLIYFVDDFIFNKRDFKPIDYDNFFENIKNKISQRKLNSNGLHVS